MMKKHPVINISNSYFFDYSNKKPYIYHGNNIYGFYSTKFLDLNNIKISTNKHGICIKIYTK